MKSLFFFILLAQGLSASTIDLPLRTDAGSIEYSTPGLLSRRGELTPPGILSGMEELYDIVNAQEVKHLEVLKKIKYYLLSGEIPLAKVLISKLAYSNTKFKPVAYRYLGIISFIEGQFEKSYHYLSRPELQTIPQFKKICTVKVLNQIVLNQTAQIEADWARCQIENAKDLREQNLVWLNTLIELKLNPSRGVTRIPFRKIKLVRFENDELKMLLKLALYLNQEELIVNQLSELTTTQVQDPEVRELAGQIYFRLGEFTRSYRFIEDLKSPNSENMKGNLYILRKKYELAYAQFKLALDKKLNSQNALERLLPLSWILNDWENGSRYAEQIVASSETQMNKMTLISAFLIQKGEYNKAEKVLRVISDHSRRGAELEVTQLASFTSLMLNRPQKAKKEALASCEQSDIVQCWVLFQMAQWEIFPLTIRREDNIVVKKEWEKLTETNINRPLTETVLVNQLDIEELDDKLIRLIP